MSTQLLTTLHHIRGYAGSSGGYVFDSAHEFGLQVVQQIVDLQWRPAGPADRMPAKHLHGEFAVPMVDVNSMLAKQERPQPRNQARNVACRQLRKTGPRLAGLQEERMNEHSRSEGLMRMNDALRRGRRARSEIDDANIIGRNPLGSLNGRVRCGEFVPISNRTGDGVSAYDDDVLEMGKVFHSAHALGVIRFAPGVRYHEYFGASLP